MADDTRKLSPEKKSGENAGFDEAQTMSDHELLAAILQQTRKEARASRVAATACTGIFVAMAIALLVLLPRTVETLSIANAVMRDANEAVTEANTLVKSAQRSLEGLDQAIANIDGVVVSNADYVTEAMEHLNGIDFDGLNNSIKSLETVIAPLARLMGGGR